MKLVKVLAAAIGALAGVAVAVVAVLALMAAHESNALAQGADSRARHAEEIANSAAMVSVAKITSPTDLQTQECTHLVDIGGLRVEGTATMRHDESLWLLLQGQGDPVFYVASERGIKVNAKNAWSADTGQIGSARDARAEFTLLVVSADYNGANQLQRAHQTGEGSIPALPPTVKPLASACVVRK